MYAFTEFYEDNGALNVHIECYNDVAKHYADYFVDKENADKLKQDLGEDVVKELTKRFSANNTVIDYFTAHGVSYVVTGKGYEDSRSDV